MAGNVAFSDGACLAISSGLLWVFGGSGRYSSGFRVAWCSIPTSRGRELIGFWGLSMDHVWVAEGHTESLEQGLSTFLLMQNLHLHLCHSPSILHTLPQNAFNLVTHVVVTPIHKIIFIATL